ncbi:MAG TPA: SPOR domain-containing protein [Bryobacteraceae bacterium]|nr:SPOR domain-containing protein [Bryobacteraceae bacterium]
MVTVGSSSATDASPERDASEAAAESSGQRVPLIAIPITLSVGLLVAAGYVGNRIIASRKHATAVVVASAPVPSTVLAAAVPASPRVEAAPPIENPPAVQRKVQSSETPVAKPPADPSPPAAVAVTNSAEDSDGGLIAPRHGERYLQIAAVSASVAQKYLAGLGRYNLQTSLAPGPHDGLVRVVIGPFPDWDSVSAVKSQIQAMWPDCFVRLY